MLDDISLPVTLTSTPTCPTTSTANVVPCAAQDATPSVGGVPVSSTILHSTAQLVRR